MDSDKIINNIQDNLSIEISHPKMIAGIPLIKERVNNLVELHDGLQIFKKKCDTLDEKSVQILSSTAESIKNAIIEKLSLVSNYESDNLKAEYKELAKQLDIKFL